MTARRIALTLALSAVAAGGLWTGLACSALPADLGLADGHLRPCPDSPNCVNSEGGTGTAAIEPLSFSGDPQRAFASLIDFLRAEPRVELVTVEPSYVHAVFRTRWLRFRDDLELRLDAAGSRVHVRSASRVGHSDLGANRSRVESIRARWTPPAP